MYQRFKFGVVTMVAAFVPFGWATGVRADSIPINNSSFENATGNWMQGAGTTSWGASADWEKTVLSGTGTPANTGAVTALASTAGAGYSSGGFMNNVDGSNILNITADPGTGALTSTYTFIDDLGSKSLGTYAANMTYTLTAAAGIYSTGQSMRSDYIALAASSDNFTDKNAAGNAGYADYAEAVASNTLAWTSANFPTPARTLSDYSVILDTATDPSLVGQSIGVVLGEEVGPGAQYSSSAFYDNIRLTSAVDVPEPASLALLGLGGLALLGRRRSSRRA